MRVAFISCVKTKADRSMLAKDLYISPTGVLLPASRLSRRSDSTEGKPPRAGVRWRNDTMCEKRSFDHIARTAQETYSGNPAFRRPSMVSFEFEYPLRAINPEIVKAGSTSSRRAAASRASASRPRWAKADARQR